MECSCQMRPFQRWLQESSQLQLESKTSVKCSTPTAIANGVLHKLETLICDQDQKTPIKNNYTEILHQVSSPEELSLASKTLNGDELILKWNVDLTGYKCGLFQLYTSNDNGKDTEFYTADLDCQPPQTVIEASLDLKKVGLLAHNIHPVASILACATILKPLKNDVFDSVTNCTRINLQGQSHRHPIASLKSLSAKSDIIGQVDIVFEVDFEVNSTDLRGCRLALQIEADAQDFNERVVATHQVKCEGQTFSFYGLRVASEDALRVCGWLEFGPDYWHTNSKCIPVENLSSSKTVKANYKGPHTPTEAPVLPLVLTLVFLGVGIAALVVLYLIVKGYLSDRHKANLFRMRFCSVSNNNINSSDTNQRPPLSPPGLFMRWTSRFFAWKRRHHRLVPASDEMALREDSTFDTSVV